MLTKAIDVYPWSSDYYSLRCKTRMLCAVRMYLLIIISSLRQLHLKYESSEKPKTDIGSVELQNAKSD